MKSKFKNILIGFQFSIILILSWQLYTKPEHETVTQSNSIANSQTLAETSSQDNSYKTATLTFNLIKSEDNTWGYQILLEGSVLIIQPNRPGLPGNKGFDTKEQASKVATLIIEKIRQGQMPPTISLEELRKLRVL